MLHPPQCFPAVKREIHTENRFPSPRISLAFFARIKGSQQYFNTGFFPPWVVVAGGVVAAAAAAVAAAVAVLAAVAITAMLRPAAVVVADFQWKHCTGIKEVGGRPSLAADFAGGLTC